jgi:hypothetical protein
MKCFIRGHRGETIVTRDTNSKTDEQDKKRSNKNIANSRIVIGPNCKKCILSVRDVEDLLYCLRFHENICKYDDTHFKKIADEFQEKHGCVCGVYAYDGSR